MRFTYSCFISYQRLPNDLLLRFVTALYEALSKELAVFIDLPVFFDDARLELGDQIAKSVTTALSNTVCMIPVFTPTYFSQEHIYCAWEYKTMERIEQERFSFLPKVKGRSLIIPIILRGERRLPQEIRDKRQYLDFSDYLLADDKISSRPVYFRKIQEIAEYIYNCYRDLEALPDNYESSREIKPLERAEVQQWLSGIVIPKLQFPLT